MKIYARVINGSHIDFEEVKQEIGLKIVHDGKAYILDVDHLGRLMLTASEGALVLVPNSSNRVIIRSED